MGDFECHRIGETLGSLSIYPDESVPVGADHFNTPVIMMSQNRQSIQDRLEAKNDFLINQKAEEDVRSVREHLEAQKRSIGRNLSIIGSATGK